MNKKIIYRKPLEHQDRFLISTTYVKTTNARRSLETCKEMYVNRLNASNASSKEMKNIATACVEVAMEGIFDEITGNADVSKIVVQKKDFSPEKLRMKVFSALLCGALGIEYDSIYDDGFVRNSGREPLFHYIKDMNYRIEQYGRTLMALKNVGVYGAANVAEKYPELATSLRPITESQILAEQELPDGLVLGEFVDSEGNRYLMYQNVDCEDNRLKAFNVKLQKNFRSYRINPHNGKQVPQKGTSDVQKILIMPGDGDLLRYQDDEEEAFLIEYALKK